MFRLVYYRLLGYGILSLVQSELRDDLGTDTVLYYFQMLANLSATNHFNVLVVSFPRFDNLANSVDSDTSLSAESESLQAGLDYLNLLGPMRGQDISFDSVHPSPIGHRCAAEAIANRVQDSIVHRPEPAFPSDALICATPTPIQI
jgi:hypothetical protein